MPNKHLHIGSGGLHCTCCFPAPGSRDRRSQFRKAKRKAQREAMREAYAELEEHREFLEEQEASYFEVEDYYDFDYDEYLTAATFADDLSCYDDDIEYY